MAFDVGSLVRARGRDWVVQPRSTEVVLVLRPLGGSDDEEIGLLLSLGEAVFPAEFKPPSAEHDLGDHRSCGLLRDAVRLGFRAGVGPFRSFGRLGVEPRPYQLAPLMMALRQRVVRVLIADDVGIGKTVEALLIAAELRARGEISRIAVLCPAQLVEAWRAALAEQFTMPEAVAVLPSTAPRLERDLREHTSIFERYPVVVVSLDYIKSPGRRLEFARVCPDFVIVDEAHTCAAAVEGAQQQRHRLLRELAANADRHLVLVTATPHAGDPNAFRSLMALMNSEFDRSLPDDFSGRHHQALRERMARHLIQRQRADLKAYLGENPFPQRERAEARYALSDAYQKTFKDVLDWCRTRVANATGGGTHQRVRWWSAMTVLRTLSSSPSAAIAALRGVAPQVQGLSEQKAGVMLEELGRRTVLDASEAEDEELSDEPLGIDDSDGDSGEFRRLAERIASLLGQGDPRLRRGVELVEGLLGDGFCPVVFCRFVHTAEYVRKHLAEKLGAKVAVRAVTGQMEPEARLAAIEELALHERRVLVCTDCLSEGVNLQHAFDAVVHYDLSWTPTRHEQREGRVDRYGQRSKVVRTVTLYSPENPIDGLVLNVLHRRNATVAKNLGIEVHVLQDERALAEALWQAVLFQKKDQAQMQLALDTPEHAAIGPLQWTLRPEGVAGRVIFAQRSINLEDVRPELEATRTAFGDEAMVERFVRTAVPALHGLLTELKGAVEIHGPAMHRTVRSVLPRAGRLVARFTTNARSDAELLRRTHPLVEALAGLVVETALDVKGAGAARRCGVVRTPKVSARTVVLIMRLRFHLVTQRGNATPQPLLAEELVTWGYDGTPAAPRWLDEAQVDALLAAPPEENMSVDLMRMQLDRVLRGWDSLRPAVQALVQQRKDALSAAHQRVRDVAEVGPRVARLVRVDEFPAELLGVSVYLPVSDGAGR